ncbi:MAG TPA: hypothetical protein VF546_20065 [Pyrinomonadaceae bacterium]|jgi:hypothetical protein
MNDIREALILIFLWLMVAGYVLLALFLFAHILFAFVRQWRAARPSVKGPAHANGLDRRADVGFKPGAHGLLDGGRNMHSWAPARVHAAAAPLPRD